MSLRSLQLAHPTGTAAIFVVAATLLVWGIFNSLVVAYPEKPHSTARQTTQTTTTSTKEQLGYPYRFEP